MISPFVLSSLRRWIGVAGLCLWAGFAARSQTGQVVVQPGAPVPEDVTAMNHKLDSLVIPNVDFRGKSLGDAVEFLREEARRVDTGEPQTRGVNIFVKIPRPKPGAAAVATAPFSLSMDHPKLGEALRAVAAKAGMKVKVEAYAVSLVPVGENTERLLTAQVQVTPVYFNSLAAGDMSVVTPNRWDVRVMLEKRGMTFPPGASATYLPGSQKLVVRDTKANVDLLKKMFDQP